ncbi:MAG: sigma-70 family RNA polymerase sigma factor [Chitinophagaceae bacterium]|nr:sigma-70 family RNA polymerase sigma factor [Chitinophagaceae bacterium]
MQEELFLNSSDPNTDESALLRQLAAGDKNAFTCLYNTYQPLITKLLYPFNPPVEPPEFIQDIFFKIWEKRELMPGVKSFRAYLFRMVRNRLIDRNKAFKIRQEHQRVYWQQHRNDSYSGTDIVLYNELHDQVAKAIRDLPQRQRNIFELALIRDLSRDEIAKVLNINIWTVDKDLGQATKIIKNLIAPASQRKTSENL